MGTQKRKRSSARLAGKPRASKPPVVLLLPRFPDELEPRLARARDALRRPPSRAARPSALAARPPAAERATSVGQRPARAAPGRRFPAAPPHVGESRSISVDAKIPAGAGSRTVGRSTPEGGSHPTRTERTSRVAPRSRDGWKRQDRFSMGRPVDRPTSKERLRPEIGARSSASAACPGFSVSKRRRPPKASTAVRSSNPCRSGRRSYILSRGSRSKAYTKSLSPSTSVGSARSGALNKLLNSIRESVHRLELLLLGGVL